MQCSQAVVFSSLSGNKVHYKGQRSPRGGAGLPVCTWPTAAVTQTKPRGRRLSCLHVYTLSLCTHTYSGQCDRLITAPSPRPLHSDTCGVIHTCLLWVVWERGTSVVFIWVLGSLSHSIVRQTLGLTTNTATWGTLCIYRHKVCRDCLTFLRELDSSQTVRGASFSMHRLFLNRVLILTYV